MGTTTERFASDARHAVGNRHGGQAITTIERIVSDGGHAGRNFCVLTSCYQSVRLCFDDSLTSISGIINGVTRCYDY